LQHPPGLAAEAIADVGTALNPAQHGGHPRAQQLPLGHPDVEAIEKGQRYLAIVGAGADQDADELAQVRGGDLLVAQRRVAELSRLRVSHRRRQLGGDGIEVDLEIVDQEVGGSALKARWIDVQAPTSDVRSRPGY
jgi:hypothetical protein